MMFVSVMVESEIMFFFAAILMIISMIVMDDFHRRN